MTTTGFTQELREGLIVVFGGSGFIGGHLMENLKAEGLHRIISIDSKEPNRPVSGVTYRLHDVRDLDEINLSERVSLIFNLAAVHTTPGHEPWEYYDTNVHGAMSVVKFARRHHTKSIVFTSSISVYGPDEDAKDELSPPTPVSDYGRSKFMAEQVHRAWLEESPDAKLVISRPAVVFGMGEGGNFTRLAKMLEKGFFVYPGRRDTIKSCIYVKDLASWLIEAAKLSDRYILFNGSYSERFTIEQIVDTFRQVAFPKARTFLIPASLLRFAAVLLRPLSSTGLGIHPDRIKKLMASTNVLPGWAEKAGLATRNRLKSGLEEWRAEGGGNFR